MKEQHEVIRNRGDWNDSDQGYRDLVPGPSRRVFEEEDPKLIAEEKSRQMIKQAELAKAQMFDVPGKNQMQLNLSNKSGNDLFHSVIADEDYSIVGAHLEDSIKLKIVNGLYVDFAKLLPKDQLLLEDDHRFEIVSWNSQTFFQPVGDREMTNITSLVKWEQAFRVFSTIYTAAHPHKATELIQYNHTIHYACQYYVWDNVYSYDKDFRVHLANHPERSWGIILQQAWTMRLQDRVNSRIFQYKQGTGSQSQSSSKKMCWKFNRGKCTYGFSIASLTTGVAYAINSGMEPTTVGKEMVRTGMTGRTIIRNITTRETGRRTEKNFK